MEFKFTNIDPENCSLDELEKEVQRLEDLGDFYETKQLALILLILAIFKGN